MYVIQNGANWWVDQVAGFPVRQVQQRGRDAAMGNTKVQNPLDESDSSESNNAFVADYDDEAGEMHQIDWSHSWSHDDSDELIASGDSQGASDQDLSRESFKQSLKGDMLQDPAAVFSATSPSQDRMGLFALLKG